MKFEKEDKIRRRICYAIAFTLLFMIEVLIALFVHDKFVRPYLGDILVVIVIYCGIRAVILDKCPLLPVFIFIFAAGVECLQYFKLIELLGVENHTLIRILLGATFDIKDIICYGAGCMILWGYQQILVKSKQGKQ